MKNKTLNLYILTYYITCHLTSVPCTNYQGEKKQKTNNKYILFQKLWIYGPITNMRHNMVWEAQVYSKCGSISAKQFEGNIFWLISKQKLWSLNPRDIHWRLLTWSVILAKEYVHWPWLNFYNVMLVLAKCKFDIHGITQTFPSIKVVEFLIWTGRMPLLCTFH